MIKAFNGLILINLSILAFLFFIQDANAVLQVDITQGNVQILSMIPQSCNHQSVKNSQNIINIVHDDLKRTGLYALNSGINECDTDISSYTDKLGDNDYLYALYFSSEKSKDINIELRLWDLRSRKLLLTQKFTSTAAEYRSLAHSVADAIYKRLTGESGYFNTKIVYITEIPKGDYVEKRVTIAEQDASNPMFLTDDSLLALSPRISYDRKKVVFMAYKNDIASIYLLDLDNLNENITPKSDLLVSFQGGVLSAPKFSPDNKYLLFARSYASSTDIYKINLESFEYSKLTNSAIAINTSPSYSPDMKRIAFISDRTAVPSIYVMNSDGTDQKRITRGKGSYFNTNWSPRGDWIAFTKVHNRKFYIGIIKPDGSSERLLTSSPYVLDNPTWSPNGRLLMFSRKFNKKSKLTNKLHTIDITGSNEMELKTPYGAGDPSWSS